MQTTRSGRRANIPFHITPNDVRQVVQGAAREPRALVRRRAHADDLDAVPLLLGRSLRRRAGDHGHVVIGGERLAELGEQVGGRLDAGPVVLVEDEDALSAHGRKVSRPPPGRDGANVHGRDRHRRPRPGSRLRRRRGRAARRVPDRGHGPRAGDRCALRTDAVPAPARGRRQPDRARAEGRTASARRARRLGGRDVGVQRIRGGAQRPPLRRLDRHRTGGGMGREAPRASRLAPPGDQGQRAGAAEDGAPGACRRPPRVRDVAVQPRQRRPRRPSRRGRGRHPAAAGRPRALLPRSGRHLARRRSTIRCSSSSGARATRARTSAC